MFPSSTNGRPGSRASKRSLVKSDENDDPVELGREQEAKRATNALRGETDDLGQPSVVSGSDSVLFPSDSASARLHRSNSFTSVPAAAAQARSALHENSRKTYGAEGVDQEVALADSRPTTPTPKGHVIPMRSGTTDSLAAASDAGTSTAAGYVHYGRDDDDDLPLFDRAVSPPIARKSVKRATPGVRDSSKVNSMHGILNDADTLSRVNTNSVLFPANVTNGAHDEKPPHPDHLSENETWYLLRTLVGHELNWEHARLHQLGNLELSDDDFRGPDNGENAPLDPRKLPIMRYLIKHFLLTMPIVRDITANKDGVEENIYWSEGLHPLLQKVHAAQFSEAVDQGQTKLLSRSYSEYFLDALERFISAGLKLSTRKEVAPGGPLGKLDFENESSTGFTIGGGSPALSRNPTNGVGTNGHGPSVGYINHPEIGKSADDDDNSDAATETNVHRDDATEDSDQPPTRPMSRATGTSFVTGDEASFVSAPEAASSYGDAQEERGDVGPPSSSWMAWVTGSKPGQNDSETEQLDGADTTMRQSIPDRSGAATPTFAREAEVPNAYVVPGTAGSPVEPQTPRPKSRSGSRPPRPRSRSSRREQDDEPTTPKAISVPSYAQQGYDEPRTNGVNGVSSPEPQAKKRRGFFGFLKKKKNAKPSAEPQQATSRQLPPANDEDSFAAMAVPIAARERGPASSVPVGLSLVPKSGVSWPFGAPVPFWRGTPFQRLKWGGFEADVIGVRSSLFGKSFIIRVRRPQRLDEYVVRTEDQFRKFFRNMDKMFPDAHIRQVPSGAAKGDENIIPPNADNRPLSVMSPSESRFSMLDARSRKTQSMAPTETLGERRNTSSRSKLSVALAAAAAEPAASAAPPTRKRASSLFTRGFRSSSSTSVTALQKGGKASPAPPSSAPRAPSAAGSAVNLPSYLSGPIDIKKLPHDSQRRALRNWLRDTLSIRTVGHHRETAAFLLLGSFVPKESDLKDIRQREFIDEARRMARVEVASGAAERVRAVKEARDSVEKECIAGEGFAALSEMIRKVPNVKGLPDRYLKTIEWCRLSVAEAIFDNFVNGPGATSAYQKLKALHQAFPYFLVRQAFRLGNPATMAKVLQDILLARPFGSKSLLQKVLAVVLDDDPNVLMTEIQKYRTKIGSPSMTEKLDIFVYSDRKTKDSIRRYARDNNIELVLCILRGAEEPRLPTIDLQRTIRAGKAYRHWVKKNAAAGGKLVCEDPGARLVIDLQMYLRLVSKDRDSNMVREMLADESTADALEVVIAPMVEFIKRTYKAGNGSQTITDLEKFMDQLIIIVEALRSRVQEPQKGVRILARLLARHEEWIYRFVRDVHLKETIVEEWLQWLWTLSAFLQRGMSQFVDLDELLPTDSEDRAYLFDEVEAVTEYHTKKRSRDYQNMCRRYAGDVDADDPVSVEGDGRGKSRVDPYVDPKPKRPRLDEIPYYVSSFRSQLRNIFAV